MHYNLVQQLNDRPSPKRSPMINKSVRRRERISSEASYASTVSSISIDACLKEELVFPPSKCTAFSSKNNKNVKNVITEIIISSDEDGIFCDDDDDDSSLEWPSPAAISPKTRQEDVTTTPTNNHQSLLLFDSPSASSPCKLFPALAKTFDRSGNDWLKGKFVNNEDWGQGAQNAGDDSGPFRSSDDILGDDSFENNDNDNTDDNVDIKNKIPAAIKERDDDDDDAQEREEHRIRKEVQSRTTAKRNKRRSLRDKKRRQSSQKRSLLDATPRMVDPNLSPLLKSFSYDDRHEMERCTNQRPKSRTQRMEELIEGRVSRRDLGDMSTMKYFDKEKTMSKYDDDGFAKSSSSTTKKSNTTFLHTPSTRERLLGAPLSKPTRHSTISTTRTSSMSSSSSSSTTTSPSNSTLTSSEETRPRPRRDDISILSIPKGLEESSSISLSSSSSVPTAEDRQKKKKHKKKAKLTLLKEKARQKLERRGSNKSDPGIMEQSTRRNNKKNNKRALFRQLFRPNHNDNEKKHKKKKKKRVSKKQPIDGGDIKQRAKMLLPESAPQRLRLVVGKPSPQQQQCPRQYSSTTVAMDDFSSGSYVALVMQGRVGLEKSSVVTL